MFVTPCQIDEYRILHLSIMSLIEVLEDSIELSLGEREADFLDDPLKFFETENARLRDVCLLADMRESSESEHTLFLQISVE